MTEAESPLPDDVVPDDGDWTWVLERVCPECGVDVRSFPVAEVGRRVRANAESFAAELTRRAATAASRPRADRWSLLEYGCHVRDVHRLYLQRLELMLTEDGPQYPNWNQDVTAVEDDYGSQDPVQVATELVSAADALAERFDAVSGDQWRRTGHRSDGATFTVESFARYLLHDPEHHLWDVRQS
jgi:hypothetical protein